MNDRSPPTVAAIVVLSLCVTLAVAATMLLSWVFSVPHHQCDHLAAEWGSHEVQVTCTDVER